MRKQNKRALLALAFIAALSGCGAAYYGAAALLIASQKKTTTIDTSFPDAVPTNDIVPPFATLALSAAKVTIQRDASTLQGGFATSTTTTGPTTGLVDVTDYEILGVNFPPGYGESQSNRDSASNVVAGDKFFLRVNGDTTQAVTFDATDVAAIGTVTASRIQARIQALNPADANVPADAYKKFTVTFDPSTAAYTFRSGVPGEASSVELQPEPRAQKNDPAPDDVSKATAKRLGFGKTNGGIETSGAETIQLTVINRGSDSVTEGTSIDLYLSHDKVLDKKTDVLFDSFRSDATVAVGEARRFARKNGTAPPSRLLRRDITAGPYFVIFDVQGSGGEKVLDNNTLVSRRAIEVYQPVDDPDTAVAEKATALDFAISSTQSPIGLVTGKIMNTVVGITNYGAAVAAATSIDIDVLLSQDLKLDPPALLTNTAGAASVRINPTDPARAITVTFDQGVTGPIKTFVTESTVKVTFDGAATTPATIATVQSLVDALNAATGTPVDAFTDGVGTPTTDTLKSLLTATGGNVSGFQVVAKDIFIATRKASFAAVDRPLGTQAFGVSGTLRQTALRTTLLPLKLFTLFRIRPPVPIGDPENVANNLRQGANYVRIYDQAKATFNATTGAKLPTVNSDDFAQLEAVTQRPVNTGSIRQGQQRVFAFQIPASGLSFYESQLLVILRAGTFDAHLDLLSSFGDYITGTDDSALGLSPLLYTSIQSGSQARTFYLVVSPARFDESDLTGGGQTFELTISVNPRKSTDLGLVAAVNGDNLLGRVKQRYETAETPRTENNVLIPFSMKNGKAEVMFVLPQRARTKLISSPVFQVGVSAVITEFKEGAVPAPVEYQAELDANFNRIVFRPKGTDINGQHVLGGVYTVAFESLNGKPDIQDLRLEVTTEFLQTDVVK